MATSSPTPAISSTSPSPSSPPSRPRTSSSTSASPSRSPAASPRPRLTTPSRPARAWTRCSRRAEGSPGSSACAWIFGFTSTTGRRRARSRRTCWQDSFSLACRGSTRGGYCMPMCRRCRREEGRTEACTAAVFD
ncbi:hypothetical protein K523DRAFT_127449 [Schizophyllum commune Tattone D]|nr:hypothetical protein K523DRAFT_127449 [Schizophyllum commune Tattone D]